MKTLTLQNLKEMEAGTIIASGVDLYEELYKEPIKWVAIRGGIHDWSIYYGQPEMIDEYITAYGEKCHTESIIKELVPCNDEAFKMYRY